MQMIRKRFEVNVIDKFTLFKRIFFTNRLSKDWLYPRVQFLLSTPLFDRTDYYTFSNAFLSKFYSQIDC